MPSTPNPRSVGQLESFTTKAVAVLVLYWVLWLPGFIANLVFWRQARRQEAIAGRKLGGTGCLTLMLWLNIAVVAVAVIGTLCFFSSVRITSG